MNAHEAETFASWWKSCGDERMTWSRYMAAENAWIAGVLAERAATLKDEPSERERKLVEALRDLVEASQSAPRHKQETKT